jgi:predicted 3-demethylubiquinone-9 3-methyltransferase (glyoxalase superfamily)
MLAMDSNVPQPFTFTPSISFYVTCADEAEIDRLYAGLVVDGSVMMELDAYPFARKYAWVQDRFGVSWQLVLPLQ